jgi:TPR repeat protein
MKVVSLELPELHETPDGRRRDEGNMKRAFDRCVQAAERGDVSAIRLVADCYAHGRQVSVDWQRAFQWYTRAAGKGDATSHFNLGACYEKALGVSGDMTAAFEHYLYAAEAGAPPPTPPTPLCRGPSWQRSTLSPSLAWSRALASAFDSGVRPAGIAAAQFNVGVCYQTADGTQRDRDEAVRWYRRAVRKHADPGPCTPSGLPWLARRKRPEL